MTAIRSRPTISRRAALRLGALLLAGGSAGGRAATSAGAVPASGGRSGRSAGSEASDPFLAIGGGLPVAGVPPGPGAERRPLVALAPASGAERWRFDADRVAGFAAEGAACVAVVQAEDGGDATVVALDLATGRERWRAGPKAVAGRVANVRLAGGAVYVESEGALLALDAAGGAERWRGAAGAGGGGWTLAGDAIYDAVDGNLVARDVVGGGVRWRGGLATPGFPPAVSEGRVYSTLTGAVAAHDAATGAPRWSTDLGGEAAGGPVVAGGLVLVGVGPDLGGIFGLGGDGGSVRAFDAATGEARWRADFSDREPPQRPPATQASAPWIVRRAQPDDHGLPLVEVALSVNPGGV